jgi:HEAT repeat protein
MGKQTGRRKTVKIAPQEPRIAEAIPRRRKLNRLGLLINDLDNPDKAIRLKAVKALGHYRNLRRQHRIPILGHLDRIIKTDPDPLVRENAIATATNVIGSRAYRICMEVLQKNEKPEVKNAALLALLKMKTTWGHPITPSKEDVSVLIKVLKKGERPLRTKVIEVLKLAKHPSAYRAIRNSVKDRDDLVREEAVSALVYFSQKIPETREIEIIDILVDLIKNDPSSFVRQQAIRGLSSFRGAETNGIIASALGDTNRMVQYHAVGALAKTDYIPSKKDIPKIIRMLRDKSWTLRKRAIIILGRTEDPRALRAIKKMLDDRVLDVSMQAREILDKRSSG